MLIGIDEVGRGCWAGPLLVVAARQLRELPQLKDSKLLSKKQRQVLIQDIRASCQLGEGWVEPEEIDALGLTEAMRLGVERALQAIDVKADDEIIMDGNINYCSSAYKNVLCVVKADNLHPVVSAASIHAKVRRDERMAELSNEHPGYGFELHVGYGTALHKASLQKLGVSKIHRKSFKPVYNLLNS